MANMLAKYSAFVVTDSPEHDWLEVYATIGRYGPIVDCCKDRGDVMFTNSPKHDWIGDWCEDGGDVMFTLENTYQAQRLKWMSKLDCGSTSVSIRPVPLQSVVTEQPPASDGASSNILEHLNDVILCEIFQSRALDLDDLCSIGSACVRFNEAAESAFRSRHRKHLRIRCDWPFRRTARVLRLLGYHIKAISIDNSVPRPFAEIVLGMIAYYCRNIEQLKCTHVMPISPAKARCYRRLAEGIYEAMPFDKLKSLTLCLDYDAQPLPHMLLPSLRNVDMNVCNVAGSDGIRQLFALNPGIKRMRLFFDDPMCPVEKILEPSSGVEELELSGIPGHNEGDYRVLGQLKHLKALKLTYMSDCSVRWIVKAIGAGSVPLERLECDVAMEPDVAIAVAKISSLKYVDCVLGSGVMTIRSLTSLALGPKLEEIRLHLFGRGYIDDLHELLTKAPDQLRAVTCDVYCNRLNAEFNVTNRRTIAIIDRMAKDRGIQLQVTLYSCGSRKNAKAQLQQFSDWLIVF